MRASKLASVAALLGGVVWLVGLALLWRDGGGDLADGSYLLGAAALTVALLAAGYATVATAPLWLRFVVSVAVVALGWVVLTSVDSAARAAYPGDGWLHEGLGVLVSAVVALVVGLVGLGRARASAPAAPPAGGHRAAR